MNINYISPYSLEKCLGKELNRMISLFDDNDWVVMTDADAFFLTPSYGHIIRDLINVYSDAGIITCRTNRTGKWIDQRYEGIISDNADIRYWRKIAIQEAEKGLQVKELEHWIAGYLMIFSKKTWQQVKFREDINILNVDKHFSNDVLKLGKKILLSEGLFIFHYYRLLEGERNIKHLQPWI